MKAIIITGLIFLSFYKSGQSQELNNYFPQPQEIIYQSGKLVSNNFTIQSSLKLDSTNLNLLKSLFPESTKSNKKAIPVVIADLPVSADIKRVSGAYSISVLPNKIEIAIFDQPALFYAAKTLQHLVTKTKKTSLPLVQINDYPDVLYRGTVEGFYGTPWSFEDRIRQLKFYGDIKMNTYIYGPKDDPYHSSPDWREPYPAGEAEKIKKLVQEAKRNYVDFVWAIHPGKDIQWNLKDSLNLLSKFEKMYDLGVRSFAVFFDDIGGEGTKPEKQAAILNYLHHEFIAKHTDVKPLIMCPTEYNKGWANPKPNTYLDILGDQLHPSIEIMWTGDRVISDIDRPTMDWINARIKRKAFIWWNFPVSDYVRDHLLMGPVYGNGNDIDTMISGFVSNPMERAEASKIGIYGASAYAWNMKKFDSEKAFDAAINTMMPTASWALKIFAENNSDLGPNGHGYRRTESVKITPFINTLKKEFTSDVISQDTFAIVKKYFDSIALAPGIIMKEPTNNILVKEISPWLKQFELLGKTGSSVLGTMHQFKQKSTIENWDAYLKANELLQKIKYIDTTENQNQYQPGIKTGSLVLTPFVKTILKMIGDKVLGNSWTNDETTTQNEKLGTNIGQLSKQPLQITETSVSINPLLEIVRMQPNEYFSLSWLDNRIAHQLRANFDSKGFEKWGRIESSSNSVDWIDIKKKDTVYKRQMQIPGDAKFVRFINVSDCTHQIYLKEFSVRTNSNYNSKDRTLVFDKNAETAILLQAGDSFSTVISTAPQSIELFLETFNQPISVVGNEASILYKGTKDYVILSGDLLKDQHQFKIINNGSKPIRVVEWLVK